LKKGDALSPFFCNFAIEYAIRRVQVIQNGLKLNGTFHIFVYANDFIILLGRVHTKKENADALVVAN
jgi:hypothetical protein